MSGRHKPIMARYAILFLSRPSELLINIGLFIGLSTPSVSGLYTSTMPVVIGFARVLPGDKGKDWFSFL